jgi:hypothetical protein
MPPSLDRPSNQTSMPIFSGSSQTLPPYVSPTAPPLGNYREAYTSGTLLGTPTASTPNKPYYASMGLSSGVNDSKLLDKINYMIHMLENMEAEKTANITEEFVLYSFTGIFIIFVLDRFLKTGKYVR